MRFFILGMLLVPLTSTAADAGECFNLLKYVPPAFNYHLFELTPDFSLRGGTSSGSDSYDYRDYPDTVMVTRTTEDANSSPRLGINGRYEYYGWKGGTEWVIGSYLSLSGNLNYEPGDFNERKSPESVYQTYLAGRQGDGSVYGRFSVSAAHYIRWPWFIGAKISPEVQGGANRRNSIYKYYSNSVPFLSAAMAEDTGTYKYEDRQARGRNYRIGCTVNVRTGMGHIDDVSFAVAALNMLDRIAETGKSYKGCSAHDVQKLAALIERKRKRRAFDSRIAFIENIDTLCTFIRESGIADELSPRTVLELADQWEYVFRQERNKGFKIMVYPEVSYFRQYDRTKRIESECELGISGSYSLNDNDDNDFSACVPLSNGYESWYRKQDLDYSLNLQARYERPLSRYCQLSLNAQGRGGISREWNSSLDTYRDTYAADPGVREYRYALPMISAGESVSLAYYPNTRTSMKITENAEYWREFDYFDISGTRYGANELPLIDGPNYDQRGLMVSLNGDASYYFSPQVQAGLSLRLAWSDSYRYFYGRTPWPGGFYYYSSSYATHVSTSSRGFDYSIGMNLTWKLL